MCLFVCQGGPGVPPIRFLLTGGTVLRLGLLFKNPSKIQQKSINESTKIAHTRVLGASSSDSRLLGAFWARLGRVFGASWARLGRVLEASWRRLSASWAHLGASWAHLARLGHHLGRTWARLAASWSRLWACWSRLERVKTRPVYDSIF